MDLKRDSLEIFWAGAKAVAPEEAVKAHLKRDGERLLVDGEELNLGEVNRVVVVGAGKASARMARAVEEILGDRIEGGLIVVKDGHGVPLQRVGVLEASHPVPDERGLEGARRIVELLEGLSARDLAVCLISGGGSALMPYPVEGITLEEKQATTEALLASGATIHEVNAVRKHLSRTKGGRLALYAFPARVLTLLISDVVGDDLDVIASGPTVPDRSTYGDALAVVDRYDLGESIPPRVLEVLRKGARGEIPETPKPGHGAFERVTNLIVASNLQGLLAAKDKAKKLGYNVLILSSMIEGETRDVAKVHAGVLKEILKSGNPLPPPACIISGGETTVTIRGRGRGGRNQEFVLQAALEIAGWKGAAVFSAGTDGTDGPTEAAGAWADWKTVERAKELGLDPEAFLLDNDSYHFFKALGDLVITGPTGTNVMDLRILLASSSFDPS